MKLKPPCPGDTDQPPGKVKEPSPARPCGKGSGKKDEDGRGRSEKAVLPSKRDEGKSKPRRTDDETDDEPGT